MNIDYLVRIKKALPENIRIKIDSVNIENFTDLATKTNPPECHFIQFIQAKFYGEKSITNRKQSEGWLTIGEIDNYDDIIFLWDEQYDEYLPIVLDIVLKSDLEVVIRRGSSQNYTRYYTRGVFRSIN